jgi:putative component of toxin-antitoxin plasmid stabilization module
MKLKTNETFTKWLRKKKLEIQKIRSKLESIIFGKLGLKDAIKNK